MGRGRDHKPRKRRARSGPTPATIAKGAIFNQLYNERGWKLRDIGARFGVSYQSVQQTLIAAGFSTKRPPKPDPTCLVCGEHYREGHFKDHLAATGHKRQIGYKPEIQKERNDAVVADYLAGELTTEEIGLKHGVPQEGVYGLLRRRGLRPDRGGGRYRRTEVTREKLHAYRHPAPPMIEMRLRGVSPKRISEHFGIPLRRVYSKLQYYRQRDLEGAYPPIDDSAPLGPYEPAGSRDLAAADGGSPQP